MKLNNILNFFRQDNNGRKNLAVLNGCRELGFSNIRILKALIVLNGVNPAKLANGISKVTLYKVINFESDNAEGRKIVAQSLGLEIHEIFEGDQQH